MTMTHLTMAKTRNMTTGFCPLNIKYGRAHIVNVFLGTLCEVYSICKCHSLHVLVLLNVVHFQFLDIG